VFRERSLAPYAELPGDICVTVAVSHRVHRGVQIGLRPTPVRWMPLATWSDLAELEVGDLMERDAVRAAGAPLVEANES